MDFVTQAEVEASLLLNRGQHMSNEPRNVHKDADKIIELAERIKAERATAAMVGARG